MAISIGSFTLDDSYVPSIKVSYEYARNSAQEIIGGAAVYSISGKVIVPAGGASTVMSKLKSIRDLGKLSECVQVVIDGFYSGKARITNVNIDQGSDPSWINQGEFSIELKAPLNKLPPNTLNLTAEDAVTDISISEVLEIGEESHSYYYATGDFNKGFIKFTNKVSVTCKPFCSDDGTPLSKSMSVLNKVLKLGISNSSISSKYASWAQLLQSRTMEINTDGGISFTASMILVPPGASASALVDINFSHNENYQDKSRRYVVSGTVTGLVNVPWGNLISLGSTSSVSKFANANSVFGNIQARFSSLGSWAGTKLTATEIGNCPINNTISQICSLAKDTENSCLEPLSTTVSKSRTDGVINFTFEWGTSQTDNCINNGKKTEITIDVQESQPQFVEHVIPRYGTLIQDINCRSAKRVTYTSSTTTDDSSCSTSLDCSSQNNDPTLDISEYISGDFLLIGSSISKSRTSYIVKREYIERCA